MNNDLLLMDFDAKGFYTTSMADCESIYPKIESGFENDINDDLVNSFNNQSFTKGSALLRKIY